MGAEVLELNPGAKTAADDKNLLTWERWTEAWWNSEEKNWRKYLEGKEEAGEHLSRSILTPFVFPGTKRQLQSLREGDWIFNTFFRV